MRNTKKQGQFTLLVYQEKPRDYIGVCLEFDLIQEGKTPIETMGRIKEASINYLKTVIKFDMDENLLNRPAPKEYWKKYKELLEKEARMIKLKAEGREIKKDGAIPWEEFLQEHIYNPDFLKQLNKSNV